MKLDSNQTEEYQTNGFLFLPGVFTELEVEALQNELTHLMNQKSSDIAYESDGSTIRALHGCHLRSDLFDQLSKQFRLVNPVIQLLSNEDIYLHQFKVNVKKAFNGEFWPWHQDFVYWHMGDGIPTPRNLTALIFLDDINEFNAPVFFIPGSQAEGSLNNLDLDPKKISNEDWTRNFGVKPNYIIDEENINRLVNKYGLISAKGKAGSIVFFDSNVIHASSQNISPYNRKMVFLAYNCVDNTPPHEFSQRRPEFLASRDYRSLKLFVTEKLI